ncbi:SMC-Scp complex subunit ScpB [Ameyamaea chiangmaiensis]|uniref:SMC-Scp complex subunit ScpB n=1 Tax=Ameyamaea chiangmaiensis TaxID=442969 RepID=A0A850PD25_9PROT|nr:SMC-Scp complex subunit ScpB [Ameyamaea chiangmaiensis]NVN41888.1 SMC-Scp complex subunit ScpB [Ameyamaea chiangmaiensis]
MEPAEPVATLIEDTVVPTSDLAVGRADAVAPDPRALRLAEAMIFASTEPVSDRAVAEMLVGQEAVPPEVEDLAAYVAAVMAGVVALYDGRGVAPVRVAGGWQFRTDAALAPALTKLVERPRRLGRSAMETLAIVAYHQPCTRAEIEAIRGVALSQSVLDGLLEEVLIVPRGRKEVPGRPVLWGTSADFLRHFGLRDLRDLPRREELMVDVPQIEMPTASAAESNSPDDGSAPETAAPPADGMPDEGTAPGLDDPGDDPGS